MTNRLQSVDCLRGLVMVLMAIDHVRVYAGIPAGGPDLGIFFTRWVTHFCAPAFAFFAGTGAFLYYAKTQKRATVAEFLLIRGAVLIVLEFTLIRFLWAFRINYSEFVLAGVIWMLGACMMIMAALIWLRPVALGVLGLAIIFLQSFLGQVPALLPDSAQQETAALWALLYQSGIQNFGSLFVLYSIVPWIGVMAAGYAFGTILMMDAQQRDKMCLIIGLSATLLFLIAGSVMAASSSGSPQELPFGLRLLNQNKYPASPFFLLMTLGPTIALIPFAEKAKGWLTSALVVIGKVPFFYYLLHILIIHLSALVVQLILLGQTHGEWYQRAPFTNIPPEGKWGLPLLYLVFALDVAVLYVACKWYAAFKAKHPQNQLLKFL